MAITSLRATLEKVPPLVFFAACLLSGWALGLVWPLSLGLEERRLRLPLALPLFLLASLIGVWALYTFRLGHTSNMPFTTPSQLLTSGPFRFTRNPLYVSTLLILTSLSALLDSPWVLASVPVLAFALGRFIIPGEEARLRQAFPADYTAYALRVRRWL
jgi:protein-S-isoprenylcysteine O-methyltransferase Ste14